MDNIVAAIIGLIFVIVLIGLVALFIYADKCETIRKKEEKRMLKKEIRDLVFYDLVEYFEQTKKGE